MSEITEARWAPIPGYPGYQASTEGHVRHVSLIGQVKLLNPAPQRSGHLLVHVRDADDKLVRRYVHRLVLEAFIGPSPNMFACHYDDNPANNRLDNLRWGTPQDNANDRQRNATRIKASKLQPIDVHADWTPEHTSLVAGRNALAAILANLDTQRAMLLDELKRLDDQIRVVSGASAS